MRRMFSQKQIEKIANDYIDSTNIIAKLDNKDISIAGLTSKGIANTGGLANIGNVAISGDLSASGKITGGEIIENMSGYSANVYASLSASVTLTPQFSGAVKNGNKVTLCLFSKITRTDSAGAVNLFDFVIPEAVGTKLFPISFSGATNRLDTKLIYCAKDNSDGVSIPLWINKISNTLLRVGGDVGSLTANTEYIFRFEMTFLLSENLTPEEP